MAKDLADEPGERGKGVKVAFPLAQDEDGYPPVNWEHLWARRVGDSLFELDNTPFFARGVSYRDLVRAEEAEGMNVFRELVRPSGHSTIRVILFDQGLTGGLRRSLHDLGCASEAGHVPDLIAIDVPPTVNLTDVRKLLDDDCQNRREGGRQLVGRVRQQVENAALQHAAVAQFGKPKGAVVGGDRSILTVTSPTRALIHTQATLPGGSLRIEGRFTFGTTKAVVLPVVDGSGAFAGARGSTTITQLSGRRALNVFRLRLP